MIAGFSNYLLIRSYASVYNLIPKRIWSGHTSLLLPATKSECGDIHCVRNTWHLSEFLPGSGCPLI